MTIEFPDELFDEVAPDPVPRPGALARARAAVPWLVAAAVGASATAFPVSVTTTPASAGTIGDLGRVFRVVQQPFGRLELTDTPPDVTVTGPAFGWLWLAVAVGFLVVAVGLAVRPTRRSLAVVGAALGGAGVGVVGAIRVSLTPSGVSTQDAALAAGSWVALVAGVLGVVLGVIGAIWPGFTRRAAIPAR